MSRHEHADAVHNSGVVWGRVSQVHPALLQHMEVTVSVATEWNNTQLPIPTTRKTVRRSAASQCDGKPKSALVCVWTLFLVNRTVKSLMAEVFQLLALAPGPDERYVLKLCDSEEFLQR